MHQVDQLRVYQPMPHQLERAPDTLAPRERHEQEFRAALPRLIQEAQQARDNAVNYRGFLVGCSVLAYNESTGTYKSYAGGNQRPEKWPKPSGKEKRCAERMAIEAAEAEGATAIVGIVTASTETDTGDNTHGHDVLYPCEDCQQLINETAIIDDQTTFHGVHDHVAFTTDDNGNVVQTNPEIINQQDMSIEKMMAKMEQERGPENK